MIYSIDLLFAVSGFCVSLLVGMTGVGGGSLMTPLLILLFGIHPATAVGTDLLYAAATKSGGTLVHGLNRDLGFTDADRVENIRRVGEVARLMTEAGLIVICSFISPFRGERRMARELAAPTAFLEIFVDTPLDECIRRDPKGLYAKAKSGRFENFTGLDSAYEAPDAPEIRVATLGVAPEAAAEHILGELRRREIV